MKILVLVPCHNEQGLLNIYKYYNNINLTCSEITFHVLFVLSGNTNSQLHEINREFGDVDAIATQKNHGVDYDFLISEYNDMLSVAVDPNECSTKSKKLNLVAQSDYVTSSKFDSVLITDSDMRFSEPKDTVFLEILNNVKLDIPITQWVPFASLEFDNLDYFSLPKLQSLGHCFRSFYLEYIPNIKLGNKSRVRFLGMQGRMGASLLVSSWVFSEYFKLPEIEDIQFGYLTDLDNIPIYTSPTLSLVSPNASIKSTIIQQARIVSLASTRCRSLKLTNRIRHKKGIFKLIAGLISDSFPHLFSLLTLITIFHPQLIFLCYLTCLPVANVLKVNEGFKYFLVLLMLPISVVIWSLFRIAGFLYLAINTLSGKSSKIAGHRSVRKAIK